MKKHQLLALVGTLALLVNLLVPGLAFGAAQEGEADLTCDHTGPSIGIDASPNFSFLGKDSGTAGISTGLYAKSTAQVGFKATTNSTTMDLPLPTSYITVTDTRDPSITGCNTGFTLSVAATDFDGVLPGNGFLTYDMSSGSFTGLQVLSNATASPVSCPAGTVVTANTGADGHICLPAATLCGTALNTPATHAACAGGTWTTAQDYVGTAFGTIGSYKATTAAFDKVLMNTPLTGGDAINGIFGTVGLSTGYAVTIPAGTASDTYTTTITYTLT